MNDNALRVIGYIVKSHLPWKRGHRIGHNLFTHSPDEVSEIVDSAILKMMKL